MGKPAAIEDLPFVETPAGEPVLLVDPGACHLVAEGEVGLFAVDVERTLARHALGRIGSLGLLFGAEPSLLGEEAILAVPSPGARLIRLPDDWSAAAPVDAFADGLAVWLTELAQGVGQRIEPKPRADITVSGLNAKTAAGTGKVIGCSEGIAWLRLPKGGGQLFGIEPVEDLVPLPAGAWLTLERSGETVVALDWTSGLKLAEWPQALARFNAAMAELLPIVRGFTEADEFNRIRLRQQAEEVDGRQVVGRFAAILGNDVDARQEGNSDGLIDVLRLIGRKLHVSIKRPSKSRRAQMDLAPTLDEIARASDIRLQRIGLEGRWWEAESGTILARRTSGEPVALFWNGGYEAVDRSGKATRLNAQSAADIAPEAHLVFVPQAAKLSFPNIMASSLRGGAGDIVALLLTIVAGSVIGQVLPLATSLVFGVLVPAAMQDALVQMGILIVIIGIAGFAVQLAGDIAKQRMSARGDAAIQRDIWDRVTSLPLSVLRRFPSADIAARVSSGIAVTAGVRQFVFSAAATLGIVASSLWVIASNSLPLALLAAALMAIHVGIGVIAGWMQARAFSQGEQLLGTADSQMMQIVNAITKLRSAAAEERAVMRWGERFALLRAKLVKSRRVMIVYESWLSVYPILGTAALFALVHTMSGPQDSVPAMPMAAVVACLTAFGLMFAMVGNFMRAVLNVWLQKPSWTYARGLLENAPETTTGLSDPGRIEGDVEFASVGFEYPGGQPVLRSVSFRAAPGELVAVVGASGSGKSTLARLLLGLERPGSGAVYVDGQDLRSLHPGALRSQIGVVLQDDKLPPGTILEVVRGVSGASLENVWLALQKAAIADEIAAMPLGLHTMLTDAGRALSGGQVQRLSLARALLSNPSILVLDEATSALDNRTQAKAMQAILDLPITRFIIAHRISTIRHAHRILVLDQGMIVEAGSYDQLMAANGAFARLTRAQA
jgi:ABC-type bacteriocin/lantibiotic exporter with double-glycine peptidase domain